MKRKFAKISTAALAGAALLTGSQAFGALTLSITKVATQTFGSNGSFDIYSVDVTAMTGTDATQGHNAGNTQDAQILGLSGTVTDTVDGIAAIGRTTTTGTGTSYDHFITDGGTPQAAGDGVAADQTNASTYAVFSSVTATSITESGTAASTTGRATSLGGTWSVTPGTGNGNVGGVEPGKDPAGLVGADPYASNGMLMEILVKTGQSATFTGQYIDYGFPTGNALTFTVGGTTNVSGPSHSIISLIAGTTPASGYGNADGTGITMGGGGHGSYTVSPAAGFSTATTGSVAVTGFNPTSDQEIYALKLSQNGSAGSITDTNILTRIAADINGANGNNASTGVSASLITGVYTLLFPAASGYDLLLTSAPGFLATGGADLGFDFSSAGQGDTSALVGGVAVTGIAAVPEPATAAGIVIGAAGLLLGRRKNKQLV